jgi:hypothetical protein
LDNKQIGYIGKDESIRNRELPSVGLKKLKSSLKSAISKEKVNNEMVVSSLLDYFLGLFGDYRKYMKYDEQYKKNVLDVDDFITCKFKKNEANFWNNFKVTQMMERFSVEREAFEEKIQTDGIFEIKSKNM